MHTNGSARTTEWWRGVARMKVRTTFGIDGMSDTHHLYRQNTSYNTVIKNAKTFIQSGGQATWKMIEFKHNKHQIDQCCTLSKELGFAHFSLLNQGRDTAPVFNQKGQLTHVLGDYTGEKEFKILFFS